MNEPITPEQSKKLLQAIFAEEDTDEDNYPETIADKVSYSESVLTHNLQYIGKAIDRLSRLSQLLLVAERHENGLPDIITNNELRMALEPLLRVREDINEITDYLLESYRATNAVKAKSHNFYPSIDHYCCSVKAVSLKDIDNAPTIDAVPVVRCSECKWRGEWTDVRGSRHPQCQNPDNGMASGVEITDDDYCSYGERKESEGGIGFVRRDCGVYDYKYRIAFAWLFWRLSIGLW